MLVRYYFLSIFDVKYIFLVRIEIRNFYIKKNRENRKFLRDYSWRIAS